MRKAMIGTILCMSFLLSACAVTKGTKTTTERSYSNPYDSTKVIETTEKWEEETVWPWQIVGGIAAVLYVILYATQKK